MTAGARFRSQSTKDASEGEGACLAEFKGRSHLPLKGKLGWMTPRIWWESDTRYETCLAGLPVLSWSPIFCPGDLVFARGHAARRWNSWFATQRLTRQCSLLEVLRGGSIQFFRNRDFCLTQHMLHLRFAQP